MRLDEPSLSATTGSVLLTDDGARERVKPPETDALPPGESPSAGAHAVAAREDTLRSIQNAIKLGASLIVTWGVALGVRVLLPRHLGPETFGAFQFADAFTATAFVFTDLGLATYIRKEVAIRKEHASEFFGGVLALRLVMAMVLIAVMAAILHQTGRPADVQRLVIWFAVWQLCSTLNGTYAALLHAVGVVDGLALLNVASKLLFGVLLVLAFAFGGGVEAAAIAMVSSEVAKSVFLQRLARLHAGLEIRFDRRQSWAVLVASLPFYLNYLAHAAYAKLDVSLMSFLTNDTEVGWYGAASNVASLALLITPLIGWVLLPMSSRAAARSDEDLSRLMRRALEVIMVIAIPSSLLLGVGADLLVVAAFGKAYAPAVNSLRTLAPMFVLTYVAIVSATILIRLERGWTVTFISLGGLALNPTLNLILIPYAQGRLGPGGAGVGAASSMILTETYVTTVMLFLVGRRAFDRRSLTMLGKCGVLCTVVLVSNQLLAAWGWARVAIDALLYFGLAVAWKAIDLGELAGFVRAAMKKKAAPA